MKKIMILLLAVMAIESQAQLFTKRELAQAGLVFISGAAQGVEETLKYNYSGFKQVHPNANDQYWNPEISWKNKYRNWDAGDKRNAYFLSKTALVFTTDGYHLTRFISNGTIITAIVLSADDLKNYRGKWLVWKIVKRSLLFSAARGAGQYTTYKLIYKKQY